MTTQPTPAPRSPEQSWAPPMPEAQQATIEQRIKNATPEDVNGAFVFYLDRDQERRDSLVNAGRTGVLSADYIAGKTRELDADEDGAVAAALLRDKWINLPEGSRGTFAQFLAKEKMEAQANDVNGRFDRATKAVDWASKHLNDSLRGFFESQAAGEQPEPVQEQLPIRELTDGEKAVQEMIARQDAQRRQALQDAEEARKSVAVEEARSAVDDAHEASTRPEGQAAPETADKKESVHDIAKRLKNSAITSSEGNARYQEEKELIKRYHTDPAARERYHALKELDKNRYYSSDDPEEVLKVLELVGYSKERIEATKKAMQETIDAKDSLTPPLFTIPVSLKEDRTLDDRFLMGIQKTSLDYKGTIK